MTIGWSTGVMELGSETIIIGDTNPPVVLKSLGTAISRTNHRNHFPVEEALHDTVATPYAAHVRRSPHRLPRFRDRLVGCRIRTRNPNATCIAVGARSRGHGVPPRRMGFPRCDLPGGVRRLAGPRLHRPPADARHLRDARAASHREVGGPWALAL